MLFELVDEIVHLAEAPTSEQNATRITIWQLHYGKFHLSNMILTASRKRPGKQFVLFLASGPH
jgi:hypothetical protein